MIAASPTVHPSVHINQPLWAFSKSNITSSYLPFPDELIDDIIDAASYWAHTSLTVDGHTVAHAGGDKMYMCILHLAVHGTEGDFLLDKENLQGEGFVLGGLPPTELEWTAPIRTKPFRKI